MAHRPHDRQLQAGHLDVEEHPVADERESTHLRIPGQARTIGDDVGDLAQHVSAPNDTARSRIPSIVQMRPARTCSGVGGICWAEAVPASEATTTTTTPNVLTPDPFTLVPIYLTPALSIAESTLLPLSSRPSKRNGRCQQLA